MLVRHLSGIQHPCFVFRVAGFRNQGFRVLIRSVVRLAYQVGLGEISTQDHMHKKAFRYSPSIKGLGVFLANLKIITK